MDNATAVISSDLCGTIIGYVDKVVHLGDILSQVHPYAKLAWETLTVVHNVLEGQENRDDRMRALSSAIIDMLDFAHATDAISKIQTLQDTVSSMMEQIQECTLYIQVYREKGFFKRAIRDTSSTIASIHS